MKMTLKEAEEKKAYCGRCRHWRFMREEEFQRSKDVGYSRHDGFTRADIAVEPKVFPPCILGICEKHNLRNFADEMYAGEDGSDDWECIDWEPWRADDDQERNARS